jgi:hypothetical protein
MLTVLARRYSDFDRLLGKFHRDVCREATDEVIGEFEW